MSIGTTVIELRFFNKKNRTWTKWGNSFNHNLDMKWSFHKIFGTDYFLRALQYRLIRSCIDLKVKAKTISYIVYGGNTKTIAQSLYTQYDCSV